MITLELSHPRQGLITSPAFPPPAGVVDTLGAGDTFNATVIFVFANVDIAISPYVSVLSEFTNFQKELLPAQLQNSSMNSVKICKSIKVIGCLAAKRTLAFSVKTACQVRKTKLLSKNQVGQNNLDFKNHFPTVSQTSVYLVKEVGRIFTIDQQLSCLRGQNSSQKVVFAWSVITATQH